MTHDFTPPKASGDLAFLVGAWLADGTVHKGVAKLSKPDRIFVSAVQETLARLGFPVRPMLYERLTDHGVTMYQVTVCSTKACEFLHPYKYGEGFFRPLFRQYPTLLMSGFFSGDGSLYKDARGKLRIGVANKRRDLMLTLHHYITNHMQLRPTDLRATRNGAYQFFINRGEDVAKFLEAVPMYKATAYTMMADEADDGEKQ